MARGRGFWRDWSIGWLRNRRGSAWRNWDIRLVGRGRSFWRIIRRRRCVRR